MHYFISLDIEYCQIVWGLIVSFKHYTTTFRVQWVCFSNKSHYPTHSKNLLVERSCCGKREKYITKFASIQTHRNFKLYVLQRFMNACLIGNCQLHLFFLLSTLTFTKTTNPPRRKQLLFRFESSSRIELDCLIAIKC